MPPTPEAVVIFFIADCIRVGTVTVFFTHIGDTEAIFTDLPSLTVCVLQTLASVVTHVADGGGVGTVFIHVTTCNSRVFWFNSLLRG